MSGGLNGINTRGPVRVNLQEVPRLDNAGRADTAPRLQGGTAALPNPRTARENAASQVAARQTSVEGHVKAGSKNLGAKVKAFFSRPPETYDLPEELTFSVPKHPREVKVNLPREAFLDMIKALPKGEREIAAKGLQSTIQNRINNGSRILHLLLGEAPPNLPDPSAQDVADITLALQMKAFAIGQGFSNGAFSIEDKDGRLAQYLERCPDLYLRSSSHLKQFQGETVDGHRNTQRGIDFASGPQCGLPFSRRTIVFGTIPEMKDVDEKKRVARRLYLKPESHGCRISTRSIAATFHPESYRADIGTARPRAWTKHDILPAILHGLSFLESRVSQKDGASRREKLPKDFVATLNGFVKDHPHLAERIGIVHDKKDPLKGMGVRGLMANVDALLANDKVDRAVRDLRKQVHDRWPDGRARARLGNEVMLNRDDL